MIVSFSIVADWSIRDRTNVKVSGKSDLIFGLNNQKSEIFLLGRMTTGFLVPIVIILASYSFILCRTSKMQHSRGCNRNRRVNKMIACVIASFLVSWTPNHCLTFSIYLIGKNQMPKWMYYWNSVTQVFRYLENKSIDFTV